LYGAGTSGDIFVKRNYSPTASGSAILLLGAAVLALGGCGRKAGLDLPPRPSDAQPSMTAAPVDSAAEQASKPSVFNPYYGTDAPPTAAKGQKKAFILDPLLESGSSGPSKP
jgi:predicted small lipoprotein YifL